MAVAGVCLGLCTAAFGDSSTQVCSRMRLDLLSDRLHRGGGGGCVSFVLAVVTSVARGRGGGEALLIGPGIPARPGSLRRVLCSTCCATPAAAHNTAATRAALAWLQQPWTKPAAPPRRLRAWPAQRAAAPQRPWPGSSRRQARLAAAPFSSGLARAVDTPRRALAARCGRAGRPRRWLGPARATGWAHSAAQAHPARPSPSPPP